MATSPVRVLLDPGLTPSAARVFPLDSDTQTGSDYVPSEATNRKGLWSFNVTTGLTGWYHVHYFDAAANCVGAFFAKMADTTATKWCVDYVATAGTKNVLDDLNDIAATSIVSGGAIDTSAGGVDFVTSVGSVAGSVASVAGSVAGSVGSVLGNVGGSLSGSVLGNVEGNLNGNVVGNVNGSVGSVGVGGISAGSFAAGAIDATAIATDAIGSNELAGSAITEIQAGLSTLTSTDIQTALVNAGLVLNSTTIATLASQTSFTLTAGSTDNDAYNGAVIVVTDASTATQKAVGVVLDYTGSTKTVTLATDPAVFTMAAGDLIDIIPCRALKPTVDNRTLDVTATGTAGVDWANVENPTTAVNLSATNIDADQVVASVTGAVGSVTARVTANSDQIAGNATAATNLKNNMGNLLTGTVDTATLAATTTEFETSFTTDEDQFTYQGIYWTSGNNTGFTSRVLTYTYTGNSKVKLTLSRAVPNTPANGDAFQVIGLLE